MSLVIPIWETDYYQQLTVTYGAINVETASVFSKRFALSNARFPVYVIRHLEDFIINPTDFLEDDLFDLEIGDAIFLQKKNKIMRFR